MSLKSILRGDGAVSVINRKESRRMRRSRPFTLAIDTAVSMLISAPTRHAVRSMSARPSRMDAAGVAGRLYVVGGNLSCQDSASR